MIKITQNRLHEMEFSLLQLEVTIAQSSKEIQNLMMEIGVIQSLTPYTDYKSQVGNSWSKGADLVK